jgi:hypothetical protein
VGGYSGALQCWQNGHASEVALGGVDDLASDGADDFAGGRVRDENLHGAETGLHGKS